MSVAQQIGTIGNSLKVNNLPEASATTYGTGNRFYTLVGTQDGFKTGHTYKTVNNDGVYSWTDTEGVPNKLPTLIGVQDATNSPYEITASDLEGMTKIGDYAFYRKTGLVGVDLSNITNLGNGVFQNCSGITEIKADKLTTVGTAAFSGMSNLKKFSSLTLTKASDNMFSSTPLEEIDCPELTTIGGSYSMGGSSSKKAFIGKDLVFPKVTSIAQTAFEHCGARSMSFPSLVSNLQSFTFYQNPNLEEIDLPLLETAPTSYFVYQCPKVAKLVLPKLTALLFASIYYGNTNLKLIDLPSATSLTCYRYQLSGSSIRLKLGYDGVVALNKASNAVFPTAITEVYVHPNRVEEYNIATNWVDWVAQGTVTIKSLDDFVE